MDEVSLLERELARAWSSLKLEEQRNRELPPMVAAATPEEYDSRADEAVERIMNFLREKEIVTVTDLLQSPRHECENGIMLNMEQGSLSTCEDCAMRFHSYLLHSSG